MVRVPVCVLRIRIIGCRIRMRMGGFRQYREKDIQRLCDPASWQKKLNAGSGEKSLLLNGTFEKFTSYYNLVEAALLAQKRKRNSLQIRQFNKKFGQNIQLLREQLLSKEDIPCFYRKMTIYEKKERNILIAPFYPHRIIHQAIVLVMKDIWTSNFISNTYACIKGRGIHACMLAVGEALKNRYETRYCLKIDMKKYFDSIDHRILKELIAQEIDDEDMFKVICNQIDTVPGGISVPIGNLTSQYFANIYLTPFDHFCQEVLGFKYYFRYMDDVVIMHHSKDYLHFCRIEIEDYLNNVLKLKLKSNWQVFPVSSRHIDFVGYKLNHKGVMLRKGILMNFYNEVRKLAKFQNQIMLKQQLSSHYGWLNYIDKNHKQNILKNAEIKHKIVFN